MKENRPQSGMITLGGEVLSDFTTEGLMKKITRITHDSYIFKARCAKIWQWAVKLLPNRKCGKHSDRSTCLALLKKTADWIWKFWKRVRIFPADRNSVWHWPAPYCMTVRFTFFDEATSNVDVESENKIMEIVQDLAREKSVILISHRLANVTAADKILYMEQGKIAESGTHEQLIEQNKAYAALFNKQQELEHFREEAV